MRKSTFFSVAALGLCVAASAIFAGVLAASEKMSEAASRTIVSPNGRVKIDFEVGDVATYRLTFDGEKVLDASRLGLTLKDEPAFGPLKIVGESTRNVDQTWGEPFGKQAKYVDRCVESSFVLQGADAPNRRLTVVFRAYDDGIAFRYLVSSPAIDKTGTTEICVLSDDSEFAFGENLDVWATTYRKFNTSQEEFFLPKKLSDVGPDSFVGSPLIVRSPKFIAALTESDLLDWAGAQFATSENASTVKIRLTPRADNDGCVKIGGGTSDNNTADKIDAETRSPWRVVLLGKKPIDLINNSGIVTNVATPCVLADVSWIEPGNSSWDWWAPKGPREMSDAKIREFVDFSAEMGWRYATIDAGWSKRKNFGYDDNDANVFADGVNIPKCVEYANSKNVRLFLWFHCDDLKKAGVEKTLKTCADWAVAGVKIDFMDSDNQETVEWLTDTCRIAAQNRLLVDYHGMYKPTGMNRTFPNQITREGIRGNEYNRWSAQTSAHLATLPFTRCLLGPADYTPGGFRNEHPETFQPLDKLPDGETCRVVGTRARELALCAIIDSPLRMFCDLPENYRNRPGIEFLRDLPTVWDETTALDGEIGEFVVLARRSGEKWFVSALTNEKAREIKLSYDFLEDGAEYEATIYADSPETDADANKIAISKTTVEKGDVATLKLVRDGGWNVVLTKK